MQFQKIFTSVTILIISSLTSFGDLIAGINFGDNQAEIENKLKASPLADAEINSTLFGRTGINGTFKTTRKLGGYQYSIYYNWDSNNTLENLNFHSQHISTNEFQGELKSSWFYLTNFLSSLHGKATNPADYPTKGQIAMDAIYFTHEWKTENGYLYMGPGLEKDGYTLVITFSKKRL